MSAPGPWVRHDIMRHDGQLDDLLLDAIRPVVDALARAGTSSYVARHWQRGPHVRLLTERAEGVPELLAQHVQPWIHQHCSTVVLDEDALLPRYRIQAEAEDVAGPLVPHHPDNSIVPTIEDVRDRQLGSVEAWLFFRDSYVRTTPLILDALAKVREGADRRAICLSMMLSVGHHGVPGGLDQGYVSFRSHAEAFLAEADPRGELRARWDRLSLSLAPTLDAEIDAVVAGESQLEGWPAFLEDTTRVAAGLVEQGAFSFRGLRDDDPKMAERTRRRNENSTFHGSLAGDDEWFAEVEGSAWFQTYRIVLNLTYYTMTQLGVTAMERYFLCHLAADAAERRAIGSNDEGASHD